MLVGESDLFVLVVYLPLQSDMADPLTDRATHAFPLMNSPFLNRGEFRGEHGSPLGTKPCACAYRAFRDLATLNTQQLNSRGET